MFDALSDKLGAVFQKLGRRGLLTERDVDDALREVRVALLEADVNFKVAREFIGRVRDRAMDVSVRESLTPGQQVVKIVHEELVEVLGGAQSVLAHAERPPTVVLLAGLQGSGKTTTAAKLALHLKRQQERPLLVAADVKRPAAVEQLVALGKQLDIPVYAEGTVSSGPEVSSRALKRASELQASWVIVDTAGRLSVDEEMMEDLAETNSRVHPLETLLVVDAMTGQEAVKVALDFHERVSLTGLILTKMDGDARGGAALSIHSVTALPIKFIGVGEKVDALEPYHPDRLAGRILGMGDVLTLIEKAEVQVDEEQAKALEKKFRTATFTMDDMLQQIGTIKKMGSLSSILEMVPGMGALAKRVPGRGVEDKQMARVEAIILSMTPRERGHPEIIGGSRRKRIARGSGTNPGEVNRLLNQFQQMRKMLKKMSTGKMKGGMPSNLGELIR